MVTGLAQLIAPLGPVGPDRHVASNHERALPTALALEIVETQHTWSADGKGSSQCFFRDEDGRRRHGGDRYEYDDRGRVTAIDRRWPADAPERLLAVHTASNALRAV